MEGLSVEAIETAHGLRREETGITTVAETGRRAGTATTKETSTSVAVNESGVATTTNVPTGLARRTGTASATETGRGTVIGTEIVICVIATENGTVTVIWTAVIVIGTVTANTSTGMAHGIHCGKRKRPRAWTAAGTASVTEIAIGRETEMTVTTTVSTGAVVATGTETGIATATENATGTHCGRSLSSGRSAVPIWSGSGNLSRGTMLRQLAA